MVYLKIDYNDINMVIKMIWNGIDVVKCKGYNIVNV